MAYDTGFALSQDDASIAFTLPMDINKGKCLIHWSGELKCSETFVAVSRKALYQFMFVISLTSFLLILSDIFYVTFLAI